MSKAPMYFVGIMSIVAFFTGIYAFFGGEVLVGFSCWVASYCLARDVFLTNELIFLRQRNRILEIENSSKKSVRTEPPK